MIVLKTWLTRTVLDFGAAGMIKIVLTSHYTSYVDVVMVFGQVPWAVIKVRSETDIVKSLDPRFFTEGRPNFAST